MNKDKKIFICNYWWYCTNYGAILTAYAINKIIPNSILVEDVEITKHRLSNRYYNFSLPFAQKHLKTIKLNDKYENLIDLNKESDTFIVGSDQVFRIGTNFGERRYQYLLDFVNLQGKKIAFSASFGFDKAGVLEEADEETRNWARTSLKSFDFISVREKSGIEICKDLFEVNAEWIIDPVFILEKENYNKLIQDATINYKNKIVAYVLDTNEEYKKAYKHLSSKYGTEVIETANSNISIENWLASIKECNLLVTDSFHGMCFAIIFNKPFICLANKSRGQSRFDSICEMLNIQNQCIASISEVLNRDCIFKVDYNNINQIIEKERQRGLNFLKKALETPAKITKEKIEARDSYLEKRVRELEARNNLSYQLWNKWLFCYGYYLPEFLKITISFFWKIIKQAKKKNA